MDEVALIQRANEERKFRVNFVVVKFCLSNANYRRKIISTLR